MSARRPILLELARRLGIIDDYRGVDANMHPTSDATREALLAAMGHDASDEAKAAACLEAIDLEARERLVEPVVVWREWAGASPQLHVRAAALHEARDYRLELHLEGGEIELAEGALPSSPIDGSVVLDLPSRPPLGYHEIRLVLDGPSGPQKATQQLVMAPRTTLQPEEVIGDRKGFGIWSNLYSIREDGDWGHGGLRELAQLGRIAGAAGADFVGINPLHAVANRGLDFSPYGPTSRLYRNILYLDIEAIPELAVCGEARAMLAFPELRRHRTWLESRTSIDHQAVLEVMLPVLRTLYGCFAVAATAERRQAYADYREREGATLRDFATWEVLAEHHRKGDTNAGTAWWRWPLAYRDPRSAAVERFRQANADAIDFRSWLQFELDRQLCDATDTIREAGCALGIYQDLALGSTLASADAWMAPERFAIGAQVGAPPDAYAPEGQDWGFPPFDPHVLRKEGYRAWAQLLRAAFRHTGALRIDHAMGLVRLYWIPEGRPGTEGAYVRYPGSDLLGVLALESRRAGSVVVAEDLGTLPEELPGMLADWGVLRSAVVYFERDADRFRPARNYPARALATVSTHDLAPLAGYFTGTDVDLRDRAGGFASEAEREAMRRFRQDERKALVEVLREEGRLEADEDPDDRRLRDAIHAFLANTPSVLIGVSLDDLAGESEPVNVPGVSLDAHRSWSRRMRRSLRELSEAPEFGRALRAALPTYPADDRQR